MCYEVQPAKNKTQNVSGNNHHKCDNCWQWLQFPVALCTQLYMKLIWLCIYFSIRAQVIWVQAQIKYGFPCEDEAMSWMPKGKVQKGAGKCFVQTFNYFTSLIVWVAQWSVSIWSHQTFSALLFLTLAGTALHRPLFPMMLTDVSSAPHVLQL